MAIANLQETINSYILRRNEINLEITKLQGQKRLAVYSQGDTNSLLNTEKAAIRAKYKELFESDEEYYKDLKYTDYTEIPEFEEEIQILEAKFQDELDALAAWETIIDEQLTTNNTELEEINTYLQSYKSMHSTNISNDFDFGLNS